MLARWSRIFNGKPLTQGDSSTVLTNHSKGTGNHSLGHNRSSSGQQRRQQEKQSVALTSSHSYDRGMERKQSSSPVTDLDRIMSQQYRKQEKTVLPLLVQRQQQSLNCPEDRKSVGTVKCFPT